MPTILDTLGIATCAVSYGKESSFAGKFASASITVTPKAIGVSQLRLVWAATGDLFNSFTDTTNADSGTTGIIVLPQTGQTGFRHGTTTFKDWYYEAVIASVTADGQALSRVYRFQIPAGQTTLDLDSLDEDGVVTALPSTAPTAAEPVGLSDATKASLAATQVPVLGVLATVTTAAAPTPGKTQPYNAAAGALAPVLPALSTLAVGGTSQLGVQKSLADTTSNAVTITCAGTDAFDSGATSVALRAPGELRELQVVSIGATKYWKVVGGNTPLSYFDASFLPRWKPNTFFAAASVVANPNGQIIRANTDQTTPATYSVAGWTVVAGSVSTVAGRTGDVVLAKGDVGLGNVDNTTDAAKPISTAAQTALNAKADLVGGVVPTSQIPSLALNTVVRVASRAAMLALTSAQVQPGDVAVDTSTGATRGSYMLGDTDPSVLANWILLNAPTDVVTSVNGQTGTVVLGKADVGLGNVDNTSDANKPVSTAQQTALDAKAPYPNTFTDVSLGGSDGSAATQTVGNGPYFEPLAWSTVNTDPGSRWDTTNKRYVVPADGLYLIVMRVRVQDQTAGGKQIGVGVHTASTDGPHFQWSLVPAFASAAQSRHTVNYQRIARFSAGTSLIGFASAGGSTVTIAIANMVIVRIA